MSRFEQLRETAPSIAAFAALALRYRRLGSDYATIGRTLLIAERAWCGEDEAAATAAWEAIAVLERRRETLRTGGLGDLLGRLDGAESVEAMADVADRFVAEVVADLVSARLVVQTELARRRMIQGVSLLRDVYEGKAGDPAASAQEARRRVREAVSLDRR